MNHQPKYTIQRIELLIDAMLKELENLAERLNKLETRINNILKEEAGKK